MAFAETANLAVKLTLGGNFTSQMRRASGALGKFDKDATRGYRAGTQIGVGIKRSAILAVAALGTLTGALAVAVKMGQDAAKTEEIYAQAVKNSGKVSALDIGILKKQQTALMNLAGVDDELIKSEQTRLIQMGLTGKQTAKATPLILDFAKATGIDLLTATKLFGKAAQGNVGALSRYGVQVDKVKAKVDPFGAAIDALNKKFGGTTKALSGDFSVRLAALRENLNNIAENVGIKLLPVLTRIVDIVGTRLVPAFGKFVDRILPTITTGLNSFADALSNGGAENAIRGITDALGPMIDLVKIAAKPVQAIVKAFLSLPKEVQTVLVGAFAVNKLTGGLVTNAAGGIIEAIGKGLLGGVKAPLVNVEGAVVNVNGGVGGAGGLAGAAGKGGGALALLGATGIAAAIVLAAVPIGQAFASVLPPELKGQGGKGMSESQTRILAALNQIKTNTGGAGGGFGDSTRPNQSPGSRGGNATGRGGDAGEGTRRAEWIAGLFGNFKKWLAHDRATKDRPLNTGPTPVDPKTQAKLDAIANRTREAKNAITVSGIATALAAKRAGDDTRAAVNTGTASSGALLGAQIGATLTSAFGTQGAVRGTAGTIVAGFRANRPIVSVNVHVTATQVTKSVTIQNRYGPGGGSAQRDSRYGPTPI